MLDFEGPGVCAGSADATGNGALAACFDYAFISQSYGDVAGMMDVQYSAPRLTDTSMRWWGGSYNNLYGVAWADSSDGNSKARIDLKPLNGQGVMLTHFDLGSYPGGTRGTTLTISDLSGNVLMTNHYNVGEAGNVATAFNGIWIGYNGIRIEWEDSAYNVGIDNITYEMATAVPEPETYAMLAAGLSLLALRARRRKA
ncbi:PEP-CTERM sorting domain-containing protein [Pseudoduganella sp. FT55W]|uniref:PEP-CTERM sorting domain-containing protein n=2 Tax=Duganella rivi TaxID=2666083 RepID=A0A7X4KB25_9BURK|nr:PEP-CTERM sorting domain-containing protein [Duganella rivi]